VDSGLQTSSTAGEKPAVTPDAREAARGKRFGALVPALARLGVTPDMVSWAGLGLAIACGACLAVGASHTLPLGGPKPDASWWPVLAGLMLGLSALADLLDGDLARARGAGSRFGALLDSTLDRFGDAAILTGCALHFAALGNVSYVLLACLGLTVTIQVSYVKARSETLVEAPKRSVGYWQRGERMVALLCACFLGHVDRGRGARRAAAPVLDLAGAELARLPAHLRHPGPAARRRADRPAVPPDERPHARPLRRLVRRTRSDPTALRRRPASRC
jgi:CDP-diacylglycerol--glycerol-3-phosphate 3-phosphatidyltransferase